MCEERRRGRGRGRAHPPRLALQKEGVEGREGMRRGKEMEGVVQGNGEVVRSTRTKLCDHKEKLNVPRVRRCARKGVDR